MQAEWATPYLYDAVYLYFVLASKMIADGLDYRNGALMFRKSYEYNINFTGEKRKLLLRIIFYTSINDNNSIANNTNTNNYTTTTVI